MTTTSVAPSPATNATMSAGVTASIVAPGRMKRLKPACM